MPSVRSLQQEPVLGKSETEAEGGDGVTPRRYGDGLSDPAQADVS